MSENWKEYEPYEAFYSPSIYNETLLEGVAHSYTKQQIENHARYCEARNVCSNLLCSSTDLSIINYDEKR